MKKVITVEGMACMQTVSLAKEISDQVLMDTVTEAGYTPVSCTEV
ncbi:hypothetical protein [Ruminococcus sp. 5_1_39BFAA]